MGYRVSTTILVVGAKITGHMAKLVVLGLVAALSESKDGLTSDEMADQLYLNRGTAERMRNIIALHFDLREVENRR